MTTYADRKHKRDIRSRERTTERQLERLVKAHQHMNGFERACREVGEDDASISYIPATGRYRITGLRVSPKVTVTVNAAGLDRMRTLLYATQHESQLADPEGNGL